LCKRVGGTQSRSGSCWEEIKSPAFTGNRTPVFQPIARRYTDWDMPVPILKRRKIHFLALVVIKGSVCTDITSCLTWLSMNWTLLYPRRLNHSWLHM
jgi:hypothetical protein